MNIKCFFKPICAMQSRVIKHNNAPKNLLIIKNLNLTLSLVGNISKRYRKIQDNIFCASMSLMIAFIHAVI